LRVPGWAHGAAEPSEEPTARTDGHLEFRRVFRAGETLRIAFPVRARVTYPDVRIDAVRGTFAVERGPLVLALESPDLPPEWTVNELAADPDSLASDEAGVTIDVYRHDPAGQSWPYYTRPQHCEGEHRAGEHGEGERARTRLIPYHQWANRGPATMRTWLPLASSSPSPAKGAEDLSKETAQGTAAVQATSSSSTTQSWTLVSEGSNVYEIQNKASGLLPGITNESVTAGADALIWGSNGTSDHLWTLAAG
ncbi:MAG TPA: RICIN domain-containing protein, partial [Trebonia sp.]|nr:RICIN domain-containing protein [Trebonia sp.]